MTNVQRKYYISLDSIQLRGILRMLEAEIAEREQKPTVEPEKLLSALQRRHLIERIIIERKEEGRALRK